MDIYWTLFGTIGWLAFLGAFYLLYKTASSLIDQMEDADKQRWRCESLEKEIGQLKTRKP